MKTKSTSRSAFFNPRVLIGFVLCSVGVLLALVGSSKSITDSFASSVSVPGKLATTAPAQPDSSAAKFPEASACANTKLTYKIIDTPKHTYGYDVFADGRLMIHQTSAPALPGNEGFKTKEDATKVALLVIEKIEKGEMPPTISIDEIKQLNVIK
jgi:hypothetical protein